MVPPGDRPASSASSSSSSSSRQEEGNTDDIMKDSILVPNKKKPCRAATIASGITKLVEPLMRHIASYLSLADCVRAASTCSDPGPFGWLLTGVEQVALSCTKTRRCLLGPQADTAFYQGLARLCNITGFECYRNLHRDLSFHQLSTVWNTSCHRLRVLTLGGLTLMDISELTHGLQHHHIPSLCELHLVDSQLKDAEASKALVAALPLVGLSSLKLTKSQLGDEGAEALASRLRRESKFLLGLKELCLDDNHMTDTALLALCETFRSYIPVGGTRLECVGVKNARLTLAAFTALGDIMGAGAFPRLRELSFLHQDNRLGLGTPVFAALSRSPSPALRLTSFLCMGSGYHVEDQADVAAVKAFSSSLGSGCLPSLKRLDFAALRLPSQVAVTIIQRALSWSPTVLALEQLSLAGDLTSEGVSHLASAMRQGKLCRLQMLELYQLTMEWDEPAIDTLAGGLSSGCLPNLTSFSTRGLALSRVGEPTMLSFAKAIKSLPKLDRLGLGKGAAATEDGLASFFDSVHRLSSECLLSGLRTLILCQAGDRTLASLAQLLQQENIHIQALTFIRGQMSIGAVRQLCDCINSRPEGTPPVRVFFSKCPGITGEAIIETFRLAPSVPPPMATSLSLPARAGSSSSSSSSSSVPTATADTLYFVYRGNKSAAGKTLRP